MERSAPDALHEYKTALSSLSRERARNFGFGERMTLGAIAAAPSSAALRAAELITAAETHATARGGYRHHLDHIPDLTKALAALEGRDRVIVDAFAARCVRRLSSGTLTQSQQSQQVWSLVACGSMPSLAALVRVVHDGSVALSQPVRREAAFALSFSKHPIAHELVKRSVQLIRSSSLPPVSRQQVIDGLAEGVVMRLAWCGSYQLETGVPPSNDLSATGAFHHLTLLRELISQGVSLELRHSAIQKIARFTDPTFLNEHPTATLFRFWPTPLQLPSYLLDTLAMAANLPDPFAQRAAVGAVQRSYRDGLMGEGRFIIDILARRIGGIAARAAATEHLSHFPARHRREVNAAARARSGPDSSVDAIKP